MPERRWLDVNDLVGRAAESAATELSRASVDLKVVLAERVPLAYVDGRQMAQVLIACLTRPLRAWPDPASSTPALVTVTVTGASGDDAPLAIEVIDNAPPGPGSYGPGGVEALRQVVHAHGGELVDDAGPIGLGARVRITLPNNME